MNSIDSNSVTAEEGRPSTESSSSNQPAVIQNDLLSRLPRMSTRYFAATIDQGLVVFAFLLTGGIMGGALGRIQNESYAIVLGIAMYSLSMLYFFVPEWLLRTTPGKYLMGLQVVKTDETRCDFKSAAIRTLWRLIEANPFTTLPAALMIYITPHGRRIGDYHAGTVVVTKRRRRR